VLINYKYQGYIVVNQIKFTISLMAVTCAAFLATESNLKSAQAGEVVVKQATESIPSSPVRIAANTESIPLPGSFSQSALDLQPQNNSITNKATFQASIDLEKFCKDYPYNTRCNGINQPTQETEKLPTPPKVNPSTPTQENKKSGWAISPEVSTLGVGASVTKSLTPNFNARVGVNTFSASTGELTVESDGVESKVDANVNLFNVSTLIDYHPFKNSGFRITGGAVLNNGNNIEGTVKPSNNTVTIGGETYTINALKSVKAKVPLSNSFAPYLGIGWGNAVKKDKGFGFNVNLGVMFRGKPSVEISPDYGPDANADPIIKSNIDASIAQAKNDAQKDLDKIPVYPVLSVGVSYQF
jgi:hypothetical protein